MNKLGLLITFLTLAFVRPIDAQIVQAVNRFANPTESEAKNVRAVAGKENDTGVTLLSQASAQAVGGDETQIGLQAIDLWLTRKTRFYARLTLPVKRAPAPESAEQSDDSAEETAESKLSDDVVKQLVDPFGGVLNLSGGMFTRLGLPGRSPEQERQLSTLMTRFKTGGQVAADCEGKPDPEMCSAERALANLQPEHGLFLDGRLGFKFIDLPSPADNAVAIGDTKLNVFYAGTVGLKFIHPLYDSPELSDGHRAGGLTLGAYWVGNYAADRTQSPIFETQLNRGTSAFTAMLGFDLPAIAALTFSFTPWTSDERLGKTFVFGFSLIRPTKDSSPAESGTKSEPASIR